MPKPLPVLLLTGLSLGSAANCFGTRSGRFSGSDRPGPAIGQVSSIPALPVTIPSSGSARPHLDGLGKALDAMSSRAVLDDPRIGAGHADNIPRAVEWFASNGFRKVDAEQTCKWVIDQMVGGHAYGSVLLLANGSVTPACLFEGDEKSPRWIEYLQAGGRIVQAGDVPLLYHEYPIPRPLPLGMSNGERGLALIGLTGGWSSPYWGKNEPVSPNPVAKPWGLETVSESITGFPVESVSLAFDVYSVSSTRKQGTTNWFKNVMPDMPWSGFIHLHKTFDGNNDAQLRDVWRAAHYVGRAVPVPPLPPPAASTLQIGLDTIAAGIRGRREFVRGEIIEVDVSPKPALAADAVKIELIADGRSLNAEEKSLEKPNALASFKLDTKPYAYAAYELRLSALRTRQIVATRTERIGIRFIPPETFNWEIWHQASSSPIRTELEFEDIRRTGMEMHLVNPDLAGLDAVTRHGMGFSLRSEGALHPSKAVTFEKNRDYFRLGPEGTPVDTPYSGGRPSLGISHPELRANATTAMREAVGKVARHPALRPYVLCNDDWSIYYGWDYSAPVLADFKAKTGLEAPRKLAKPKSYGAVSDNHPWIKWFDYTLRSIDGAMNKAETAGVVAARADARVGPIPGGMQIPLVQMWEPAQYPTYSFGPHGFNLISSYYYNTYWQPVMTVTYWMDIGRMGNRTLPQWNMPDAFMTGGYSRNNLFHYLAGGVRGLAYFNYGSRSEHAWPEFRRLGALIRRIAPVQARLLPARREIGMLNSFSSNCFDGGHTLTQVYGYHNLMQGHFDVEMVSEEEILAGRASHYKVVLLYNVQYLRKSVFDALVSHAASGGLVILDASVPFDIPRAKRISVDIGLGKEQTVPTPIERERSTPGILDYGRVDRVKLVQRALSVHVKPWFDSPDIKLAATRMEAGGVQYSWFVNVHDTDEYMFCRERMGAGHPGSGTLEKIKEVQRWEEAEMANGPYTTPINFKSLPGVPYDLVAGHRLETSRLADGHFAMKLSMERFGGALVAWLPEEIASIKLDAPNTARAQKVSIVSVTLYGKSRARGIDTGRKIPGVLPVEFILKDPRGNEHVVSGVRGTHNGTATWEWTPGVNDPLGTWTLIATDLTSGRTREAKISLDE